MQRSRKVPLFFVVLSLFTSLFVSELMAQSYWKAGFKGGLNISNLRGNTDSFGLYVENVIDAVSSNTEGVTGFIGGIDLTYQMRDDIGIRLEGLYTRRGIKGDFTGDFRMNPSAVPDTVTTWLDVTFDYFEIPLLAVYSYRALDYLKINAMTGPALSVHIKSDWKADKLEKEGALDDFMKKTGFSWVFGAGIEFEVAERSLVLEGRWTLGLTSIDDSKLGQDLKHNSFALLAGIAIASTPSF
jgi:opacity protein-like surface antigen